MGKKREEVVVVCETGGERLITMRGYKLSYLLSGILFISAFVAMFYEKSKSLGFRNDVGAWVFFAGGFILWMVGYAEQRKKEKNNK